MYLLKLLCSTILSIDFKSYIINLPVYPFMKSCSHSK